MMNHQATTIVEVGEEEVFKECACGRSYTRAGWAALDYVGTQRCGEQNLELRLCTCRSSLSVVLGPLSTIPAPPPPGVSDTDADPFLVRPAEPSTDGAVGGLDVNGNAFNLWPLEGADGALLKDQYGSVYKRLPHLDDDDWLGFVDTVEEGDIISVSRAGYEAATGKPVVVRYEVLIDGDVILEAFPSLRERLNLSAIEADLVRLLAPEQSYGRDGWIVRREATP